MLEYQLSTDLIKSDSCRRSMRQKFKAYTITGGIDVVKHSPCYILRFSHVSLCQKPRQQSCGRLPEGVQPSSHSYLGNSVLKVV